MTQWSDFVAKTAASNSLLAQPPLAAACAEAGLRAAECLLSSEPLLRDPVAPMLCGTYGLSYGKLFTQLMQEQEGWGKINAGVYTIDAIHFKHARCHMGLAVSVQRCTFTPFRDRRQGAQHSGTGPDIGR